MGYVREKFEENKLKELIDAGIETFEEYKEKFLEDDEAVKDLIEKIFTKKLKQDEWDWSGLNIVENGSGFMRVEVYVASTRFKTVKNILTALAQELGISINMTFYCYDDFE